MADRHVGLEQDLQARAVIRRMAVVLLVFEIVMPVEGETASSEELEMEIDDEAQDLAKTFERALKRALKS